MKGETKGLVKIVGQRLDYTVVLYIKVVIINILTLTIDHAFSSDEERIIRIIIIKNYYYYLPLQFPSALQTLIASFNKLLGFLACSFTVSLLSPQRLFQLRQGAVFCEKSSKTPRYTACSAPDSQPS